MLLRCGCQRAGSLNNRRHGNDTTSVEQRVNDLIELTHAAFRADGPVAAAMAERGKHYVHQEPQIDYAICTAPRRSRRHPANLGWWLCSSRNQRRQDLGKCYLVPGSAWRARPAAPAPVISTYTLLLQHQIVSEDFGIAAAAVRAMTKRVLRAAPRKGLRNFVSGPRVLALREAIVAEGRLDKTAAEALWSLVHDQSGDGTIRAWIEHNGKLPDGVREADVCLLSSEGADAEAFRAYLQVAAGADIVVVTTDALLVQSMLGWNTVIGRLAEGSTPFVNGVVDEADQLPRVAADVFSVRISIPMLRAVGARLPGATGERLLRVVEATQAWFDHVRPAHDEHMVNLRAAVNNATRAVAADRARVLAEVLKVAEATQPAAEDAAALQHLAAEWGSSATPAKTCPTIRSRCCAGRQSAPMRDSRWCR